MFCVTAWHQVSFLGTKKFFVPGSRNTIQLLCCPLILFCITMWNRISGTHHKKQRVNVRTLNARKEDKRSNLFYAFLIHVKISTISFFLISKVKTNSCDRKKTQRNSKADLLNEEQSRHIPYWREASHLLSLNHLFYFGILIQNICFPVKADLLLTITLKNVQNILYFC